MEGAGRIKVLGERGCMGWNLGERFLGIGVLDHGDPGEWQCWDGVPERGDRRNGGPLIGVPGDWGCQGWAVAGQARGSQLLPWGPQCPGLEDRCLLGKVGASL